MPEWKVYARRDSDLALLGELDYQSLSMVPRFNNPGSWELDVDASSAAADLLTWGTGILVTLDGVSFFSGPVTKMGRKWTPSGDRRTVTGADDSIYLARRLAYPEAPALTTGTSAYDARTGVASTVMRGYVDDNVGPSADATRAVSGLTLEAADPLLGASVTGLGRFQPLDELLRELALAGGDLGFRVVQEGAALEFQVYDPADRTGTVIFSSALGTLSAYDYSEDGPSANWIVVGGAGDGAARAFSSGGDGASIARYDRIEAFVDKRDTGDTTQLAQARDEALTQNAEQTSLSATPVDTGAFRFGVDYGLGDRVTVMVDGVALQDVVREVHVKLDPTAGQSVIPVIGTPGTTNPSVPRIFDRLSRLERAVRDLQRKV